jgi:hypothetical protein
MFGKSCKKRGMDFFVNENWNLSEAGARFERDWLSK